MYHDTRLGADGKVSCATCHDAARGLPTTCRSNTDRTTGYAGRQAVPIPQRRLRGFFFSHTRFRRMFSPVIVATITG
ncbi:MAG TPA: cytochrome c peroxidase [Gammaproteobacteria bacterium]|nr:cytochrome c peroxidase [Gammaproteobacteria bacterium]